MSAGTGVAPGAGATAAEPTAEQTAAMMRSRRFVGLLVIVALVGIVVSLAAWCYLELIHQLQQELFVHLPHALGYSNGPPLWWSVPVLAIGGLLTALAITRLPGRGGHLPANGLAAGGAPRLINVPGVLLACLATIAFGLVLGPEAPLIALGAGVALACTTPLRAGMQPQVVQLIAATGSFAALSFIFASPLIAAVFLIEVTGIGGARLPMLLVPGLLAAGIGTLVSIGMGSFTGLSSSAYAIPPLSLPTFAHPSLGQFGWTIVLAVVIALATHFLLVGGLATYRVVNQRLIIWLPMVGMLIAGLAIAFHGVSGKGVNEVLFSGESALPGLVAQAGTWSVAALIWLLLAKGAAYALSLGSFRGGPTFPALFLGAAAGLLASHLPGFAVTPAVAVGMGAATVAVLRLPLSAVVLATLLTSHSGTGDEPLIIVGVVVAYMITLVLAARGATRAKARAEARPPARSAGSRAR